MKKVLLMLNADAPPFADFARMLQSLAQTCGQFSVETSHDRNRFADLSGCDAVVLYISGGEITPDQERGLTGFVRRGAAEAETVQWSGVSGRVRHRMSAQSGHLRATASGHAAGGVSDA